MRWLLALVVAFGLAVPAAADDGARAPADRAPPVEQLEAALEQLEAALRRVLRAIPQFEMPEITDDGDIIIRRKRPEEDEPPLPDPGVDAAPT